MQPREKNAVAHSRKGNSASYMPHVINSVCYHDRYIHSREVIKVSSAELLTHCRHREAYDDCKASMTLFSAVSVSKIIQSLFIMNNTNTTTNTEQSIQATLNSAECIQKQNNIGSTAYYNVCNGSVHIVPFGGIDWFGFAFGSVMIVALLSILFYMITKR